MINKERYFPWKTGYKFVIGTKSFNYHVDVAFDDQMLDMYLETKGKERKCIKRIWKKFICTISEERKKIDECDYKCDYTAHIIGEAHKHQ